MKLTTAEFETLIDIAHALERYARQSRIGAKRLHEVAQMADTLHSLALAAIERHQDRSRLEGEA